MLARATSEDHVEELQDVAINAAWTLWHISDWIARSTEQGCIDAIERIRRERPSQKKEPLKILREHVRDDSHLALCEALALATLEIAPKGDPPSAKTVRKNPNSET